VTDFTLWFSEIPELGLLAICPMLVVVKVK
jgi:hypothetical protein